MSFFEELSDFYCFFFNCLLNSGKSKNCAGSSYMFPSVGLTDIKVEISSSSLFGIYAPNFKEDVDNVSCRLDHLIKDTLHEARH